jgi:hypothetical protein
MGMELAKILFHERKVPNNDSLDSKLPSTRMEMPDFIERVLE